MQNLLAGTSPAASAEPQLSLWIPELYRTKGGIQVYSAFLLKASQNLYSHPYCSVLLKNDSSCVESHNTRFFCTGHWPLPLRSFAFVVQAISLAVWRPPALVITTHLNFAVAAHWLKRLTGVPYWVVAHGIEAWDIQRPLLQDALQQADRILAVSSYTRDRLLQEQNLDPSRVVLLPNTFDAQRFTPAAKPQYLLERYHLKPQQPIILTVARLSSCEQYKGYDQILAALPQVRRSIPDVHYVLVGKGDDLPRIQQLLAQWNLTNCVTLAGFVSEEELCDHYNLCDVFAMPSRAEGFGIVYLEALACGKAVLGGNQDGATDALCQGELGALVDPNSIQEIAETLTEILQGTYPNPLVYQPEALRQRVIEKFGFEQFQQTLARYLETDLRTIRA